ncbi:MAG: U32 family peptidase [Faecalicoccus sp.]|nr:U32 family peptidase [Faecalicoccus sp.]
MKPEILAPVGNREMLDAALAAGCDAVYFALPNFGARAYAKNFTPDEARKAIEDCHLLGVKVYITMNTILYEDEIDKAYLQAKAVHEMGVDALIIQDLGLIHLLHERLPNLELHASTQISVMKPEQIENLKKLGVKRVVLARECTLEQIKACVDTGMDIEVFVHGAMCICKSGQCQFSVFRYDRSGNRGMCAQPCRMPYTLLMDGKKVETKGEYLLSPKDLSLIENVDELIQAGVTSLKIEGRMKSPEYVWESVHVLKEALNGQKISKSDKERLDVTFSRGFTKGHAFDQKGDRLMNTARPNHQGLEIGRVEDVKGKRITLRLTKSLHQNDGIRIGDDIGCRVNFLYDQKGKLTDSVDRGICQIEGPKGVRKSMVVRKTIDSLLSKEIEHFNKEHPRQISVRAKVSCQGIGYPLVIELYDGINSVSVESKDMAQKALKRPLDEQTLIKQITKTGNSFVSIESVEIDLKEPVFFVVSVINNLRREAIDKLALKRIDVKPIYEKDYHVELQAVNEPYEWTETIEHPNPNVIDHLEKGDIIKNMNVTNSFAVVALVLLGYKRIVVSDECNPEQIKEMAAAFKERYGCEAPVVVTLYQYPRLMIMHHCPVNYALSDGLRKGCSLCHKHNFELVSKDKRRAFLCGDKDCHMQIFDETARDFQALKTDFIQVGIHQFRTISRKEK